MLRMPSHRIQQANMLARLRPLHGSLPLGSRSYDDASDQGLTPETGQRINVKGPGTPPTGSRSKDDTSLDQRGIPSTRGAATTSGTPSQGRRSNDDRTDQGKRLMGAAPKQGRGVTPTGLRSGHGQGSPGMKPAPKQGKAAMPTGTRGGHGQGKQLAGQGKLSTPTAAPGK